MVWTEQCIFQRNHEGVVINCVYRMAENPEDRLYSSSIPLGLYTDHLQHQDMNEPVYEYAENDNDMMLPDDVLNRLLDQTRQRGPGPHHVMSSSTRRKTHTNKSKRRSKRYQ